VGVRYQPDCGSQVATFTVRQGYARSKEGGRAGSAVTMAGGATGDWLGMLPFGRAGRAQAAGVARWHAARGLNELPPVAALEQVAVQPGLVQLLVTESGDMPGALAGVGACAPLAAAVRAQWDEVGAARGPLALAGYTGSGMAWTGLVLPYADRTGSVATAEVLACALEAPANADVAGVAAAVSDAALTTRQATRSPWTAGCGAATLLQPQLEPPSAASLAAAARTWAALGVAAPAGRRGACVAGALAALMRLVRGGHAATAEEAVATTFGDGWSFGERRDLADALGHALRLGLSEDDLAERLSRQDDAHRALAHAGCSARRGADLPTEPAVRLDLAPIDLAAWLRRAQARPRAACPAPLLPMRAVA